MMQEFPADMKAIVDEWLETGNYANPEEVLRDALRALEEEDEDLTAVREAIADMQADDPGVSLEEAFAVARTTLPPSDTP